MKKNWLPILLLVAVVALCVAGAKVSQLTRTRSLQSTSRFMVVTQDSAGKFYSRYITAPDMATNIGPWITNTGSGGGSGEANVLGAGGTTNATKIELNAGKSGVTLLTKTVQAGYGVLKTNEGTNVVTAIDPAVIPNHTQVGTASNAAVVTARSGVLTNNHTAPVTFNAGFTNSGTSSNSGPAYFGADIWLAGEITNKTGRPYVFLEGSIDSGIVMTRPDVWFVLDTQINGNIVSTNFNGNSFTIWDGTSYDLITSPTGTTVFGHTELKSNLTVVGQVRLASGQAAASLVRLDSNTNLATVTIGSGLTFDGTTLAATGGGAGEANVNGESAVTNATKIGLVNGKAGVTNLLRSVQPGYALGVTNEGTNVVFAVTDAELIEFSGISTNRFLTTNHAQLQFASSNNVRVAAGTAIGVTGSGASGVQTWTVAVNDSELLEWGGISTNLFATTNSAHITQFYSRQGGSPILTNLAGLTSTNQVVYTNDAWLTRMASNGVVVAAGTGISVASSGSGGQQTFTVTATGGGSGGTNFPPVINQLGSTNLSIDVGVRKAVTITTNASFAFNLSGTPANGMTFLLGISNYAASPIYLTTFVASASSSAFLPSQASNVTVFAVPATSIRWLEFLSETNFNLGTARWNIIRDQGKEMELTAGYATQFATNSAGTLITNGVSAALQGLHANTATTVTNESSSALQINTGVLTLTPGVLSNLNASGISVPVANVVSNVGAIKFAIWTNYVPAVSNFVFSFATNHYELKNQTNVVFTNIVEELTGVAAPLEVHIHNTTGVTMGLVWPAYGAQHGYFLQTNANNPIISTTSLASGQHGVASFKCFGTNIFATFTTWP